MSLLFQGMSVVESQPGSDEEGCSEVFLPTDSDYDSSDALSPRELCFDRPCWSYQTFHSIHYKNLQYAYLWDRGVQAKPHTRGAWNTVETLSPTESNSNSI